MLEKTNGIVLRSVRYGETSIVATIFTEVYGVQSYMVQGVRSSRQSQNRAGMFQPGTMLSLVVYHHVSKHLQRIREFHPAYIYTDLQENVVKNSVALFSVEVLLRLLPENAPLPSLFTHVQDYFITLDKLSLKQVANFPLFFVIQCSRELGYELNGNYSKETPYLNLQEGGFTDHPPVAPPYATDDEARALDRLLGMDDYNAIADVELSGDMRLKLIDWFISFLQLHTQHMGSIRSLSVLRTILH
jgi:DNA repair protein RecO (recombination protein O)